MLDRDGRGQASTRSTSGRRQAQELARVGREALHVAALALGVQGVEGEGRLTRAGQTGDDHELVARNIEVDILQVVRARAAHADAALLQHRREVVAFSG